MAEPERLAERTTQFKRRLAAFSDLGFGLNLTLIIPTLFVARRTIRRVPPSVRG